MKARKIIRGCFGCGPIVVPFYDALLVFPVVVVLIVAITYLFGGRCAVWQWWTAVLIAMAVGGVRCQRESRCGFLVLFSVLLVVFWILGGILMSNGWDDTLRYHLPAIRLLIEGWNPVWQGRWEMVQSLYGIADTEARSWMILSMPKSVWYFNAAAYFFIRNPHNLLYPIVPILTASVAISVWRNFDTVPRLLRAAIFGFIILVTPSYSCVVVDTVIALSATGLLIAMWRSLKYRTWNWIELICYSFWMCTAKQVSLLHCGVFWTVFWLAAWMVSRKAQLVKFTVMAMALLVLCLVSGVSPYITQWVNFGHPLYPEYTTDEVAYPARHETADFLVRNEDAASMGHVGAYVNAFLSSGIARWYYRKTLGRESFTPDSITWLQQSGRSEGAPTSALFRTSFALGLIFLFLLGGAAERFVACAIMAGAIALPTEIFVYDNNSSDGSGEIAQRAGAIVRRCLQQGKGHVVRRMFWDVDADVYVMADSDDTYPADEVHKLIGPIVEGVADMVNGDRLSTTYASENKRPGHNFGNALVCALIRIIWRHRVNDVMTGYRAFSRRFVKSCPILSNGFEIETEMTLHTLDKRLNLIEIPVQYRDRPAGCCSKLNTLKDGIRVIKTIFNMFRHYRPFAFFGLVGIAMAVVSVGLAVPVFAEYFQTGEVPRYPTLIFSCFLMTSALLSFGIGLILDAVKKQSDQTFELKMGSVGLHV